MVGHGKADSRNSSSKYPTIRGSVASDARTPSNWVVQNLNLNFNAIRLQATMVSIQRLVPQYSPLAALAQQGAEAVVQIITVKQSMGNKQGQPSVRNRSADRGKRAQSEEASSASSGKRLADGDAHHRITQKHRQCENDHDPANLCNAIDVWRHNRVRMPSPRRRSPGQHH
jgi:hypothetical protein